VAVAVSGLALIWAAEVVAALCAILLLSWDHRPRRCPRRVRLLFAIRYRPSGLDAIFGERLPCSGEFRSISRGFI
jgi:hypothetical protein